MKAHIRILTHNRKSVVEECLPTIVAGARPGDRIDIIDDASHEYDVEWLKKMVPDAWLVSQTIKAKHGVEELRYQDFREFFQTSFEILALVDSDALCDPGWLTEAERLLEEYDRPVAMFNAAQHDKNYTVQRKKDHLVRALGQGVCLCLTRPMAGMVLSDADPAEWWVRGWDWCVSEYFREITVASPSRVEHLGWNGLHAPGTTIENYGDYALNLTPKLVEMRAAAFRRLGGAA